MDNKLISAAAMASLANMLTEQSFQRQEYIRSKKSTLSDTAVEKRRKKNKQQKQSRRRNRK